MRRQRRARQSRRPPRCEPPPRKSRLTEHVGPRAARARAHGGAIAGRGLRDHRAARRALIVRAAAGDGVGVPPVVADARVRQAGGGEGEGHGQEQGLREEGAGGAGHGGVGGGGLPRSRGVAELLLPGGVGWREEEVKSNPCSCPIVLGLGGSPSSGRAMNAADGWPISRGAWTALHGPIHVTVQPRAGRWTRPDRSPRHVTEGHLTEVRREGGWCGGHHGLEGGPDGGTGTLYSKKASVEHARLPFLAP